MGLCQCGCGAEANRRFISGHNGRGNIRKKRVEARCQHCGEGFEGTSKAMDGRKFCSHACRDNFRRTLTGSPDHPDRSRVKIICSICRGGFETTPYKAKIGATCSMECGRESRRRKIRGAKQKNRKISERKAARERDGHRCRICGFHEVVHTHHIVPKSKGGGDSLVNFITLCPNHHAMVHAGMISDSDLQKAIARPIPAQMNLNLGRVVNFRA